MFRRVHICFLGSDLCLRVHMSILEPDKNEFKYKIKTDKTAPTNITTSPRSGKPGAVTPESPHIVGQT